MVAEGYRARAAPYLDRVVGPFLGSTPATLSTAAIGLAVAAGALALAARWTTPIVFLGVAVLIFASGVFDALDGEVARRTKRTSLRGDLLDHVLDRYADIAILLGIAASGYASPVLALLALVTLLLVSYMGTQAQAVGAGRMYAGLLSRVDRLLILTGATFLLGDLALPWPWAPSAPLVTLHLYGATFTVLDLALLWFVIGGQWTAFARARAMYRSLPPAS